MKNTMKTATVIAGLMLTAAGASFGQSLSITEVKFPFRAGNANMPAGTYHVQRQNVGGGYVYLRLANEEKKSVFLAPRYAGEYYGTPSLTFSCAVEVCSLVSLKTNDGAKWTLATPKWSKEQMASVTDVVVPMQTAKAD